MGHRHPQRAPRPDEKELLHRYAVWHVLRRIRQRNRGADTTYGQLDMVRRASPRGNRPARLAARPADSPWPAAGKPTSTAWLTSERRQPSGGGRATSSAGPSRNASTATCSSPPPDGPVPPGRWTRKQRWHQAKRLLHDDNLDTDDRVAGLLLLLYAQRPATISRLTIDDIDAADDPSSSASGVCPSCCPSLCRHSSAAGRRPPRPRRPRRSRSLPWLFPGGQPGAPSAPTDSANGSA